jgi:hypothetical protein
MECMRPALESCKRNQKHLLHEALVQKLVDLMMKTLVVPLKIEVEGMLLFTHKHI